MRLAGLQMTLSFKHLSEGTIGGSVAIASHHTAKLIGGLKLK